MSAVPHSPVCRTAGFDKIVSVDSDQKNHNGDAWFAIVHCAECGHIYGVFAKQVIAHEVSNMANLLS
jgi:hypothetical protein